MENFDDLPVEEQVLVFIRLGEARKPFYEEWVRHVYEYMTYIFDYLEIECNIQYHLLKCVKATLTVYERSWDYMDESMKDGYERWCGLANTLHDQLEMLMEFSYVDPDLIRLIEFNEGHDSNEELAHLADYVLRHIDDFRTLLDTPGMVDDLFYAD